MSRVEVRWRPAPAIGVWNLKFIWCLGFGFGCLFTPDTRMSLPPNPDDTPIDATLAALEAGFLVGSGRFTLTTLIGRGGMGVVWLARDESLREDVALKFLPTEIRFDAVALDDLRRETARSRKLTHPNIIRIQIGRAHACTPV